MQSALTAIQAQSEQTRLQATGADVCAEESRPHGRNYINIPRLFVSRSFKPYCSPTFQLIFGDEIILKNKNAFKKPLNSHIFVYLLLHVPACFFRHTAVVGAPERASRIEGATGGAAFRSGARSVSPPGSERSNRQGRLSHNGYSDNPQYLFIFIYI